METEASAEQVQPEIAQEVVDSKLDQKVDVNVVKPEVVKIEQAFFFIAEKDETTGRFVLSIPYDTVKELLASGLLTKQSQIVKFSLPL